MKREEFFTQITLMEDQGVGHETDWFEEEKVIKFLTENNKDKSIYLAALKFNPDIIFYADETLKDDSDVMMFAVKEWGKHALRYASDRIKDDEIIVIDTIKYKLEHFSHVLDVVSERLRNNFEIVEFAMNCCYDPDTFEELQFASNEIKSNKNFILKQLENFTENFDNPVFLKYISDELKQDAEFVIKLKEINPNAEKYLK